MKKQQSFSDIEYRALQPKGREWEAAAGYVTMLRMYLVQNWFHLSDEATEDAVYNVQSIRQFVGINLSEESVPDATTLLHFRHILEERGLSKKMFEAIGNALKANGYMMTEGSIVDATIISAPTSTKNKDKARDPKMKSTKKGNNYYFWIKIHVGLTQRAVLSTQWKRQRRMKQILLLPINCFMAKRRLCKVT